MVHHQGLVVSGRLRIAMDDGPEMDVGPGDLFEIPAGHDAWVLGDEPWVSVDFTGRRDFARTAPASGTTIVATILFTDIVDSTPSAVRPQDAAWKNLLAEHNQPARTTLAAVCTASAMARPSMRLDHVLAFGAARDDPPGHPEGPQRLLPHRWRGAPPRGLAHPATHSSARRCFCRSTRPGSRCRRRSTTSAPSNPSASTRSTTACSTNVAPHWPIASSPAHGPGNCLTRVDWTCHDHSL